MIVLDTNQLEYAQPPDGPVLSMLSTIARETGHELGLPEMALGEHLAHVRHEVQVAHRTLRGAVRDLQRLAPYWPGEVTPFNVEPAVQRRTQDLQNVMRILPTPEGAEKTALIRETRRELPAKTAWDRPGAGGRDVVIWLTALHACKELGSPTYFVSMDRDAFGGNTLHDELMQDVRRVLGDEADRFHYCFGVDALLASLASKHEHRLSHANISAAEPVRDAIQAVMTGGETFFELGFAVGFAGHGFTSANPLVQDLKLREVKQIVAYAVGDMTWATARAKWSGRKDFTVFPDTSNVATRKEVQVSFSVSTTLVMNLDDNGAIRSAEVSARSRCTDIRGQVVG